MDFLILSVFILFITLFARLFFKVMLFISILGIVIYITVPQSMKNELDNTFSISRAQIVLSTVFSLSKQTAVKIDTEAKKRG